MPPTPPSTEPPHETIPLTPPVPPVTPLTVAPSSGTGTTVVLTFLILSLLAGGAAAGYYYWMKIGTSATQPTQALEAATSTDSAALTATDMSLRPQLETVIGSLNVAVEAGDYDGFIKVIDSETASTITKEEFEKVKVSLKQLMHIDLSKGSFASIRQDGTYAGYYFTTTETSPEETYSILSLVKFVKENEEWKIAKVYSKNLSPTSTISAIIETDPDFAFSSAVPTTTATTTVR